MIESAAVLRARESEHAIELERATGAEPARWFVRTEAGDEREGVALGTRLALGPLPTGYHHLTIASGDEAAAGASLLVRPDHAYVPPAVAAGGRLFGFACNLYALRSETNWGIGDFSDLGALFALGDELGADCIGVNPLHALHYVDAGAASPYSPTSRFFLNPFYIDVDAVPEAAHPAVRAALDEPALRERLTTLRASAFVEYDAVAELKRAAFERCHARLRAGDPASPRRLAFDAFVERGGARLERFAIYETLTEHFAEDDGRVRGWLTWPEEFRRPDAPAVAAFAASARERVDFYRYLQFLADEQLAAAVARGPRLTLGLYGDLAVGVDLNSADVWSDQDRYVLGETVGAPPDPLARQGQNWGLPPLDAEQLRREGCVTYADLLRANMAHAGALRIDHVMSLLRLFRIPVGAPAGDGAYVPYPFEELLATVAIESERAGCLVVGEDLGTVPDGFRERMEDEWILSYRLILFERDASGNFLPPEAYPQRGLATATTHDLPPLGGWIVGRDVVLRLAAQIVDPETALRESDARRIEASALLDALRAAGELDDATFRRQHDALDRERTEPGSYGTEDRVTLAAAAYRFLARTAARFVLVQLDDVLGETEQINLPGTFFQYPNWRRKVGTTMDGIAGDRRIAELAAEIRSRLGRERT